MLNQKRWRAEADQTYYSIIFGFKLQIVKETETFSRYSDIQYQMGNYFKTEQDAKELFDCIETLMKFLIADTQEAPMLSSAFSDYALRARGRMLSYGK